MISLADTTTSHFSILMAPAPHLNGKYTVFGELVEVASLITPTRTV